MKILKRLAPIEERTARSDEISKVFIALQTILHDASRIHDAFTFLRGEIAVTVRNARSHRCEPRIGSWFSTQKCDWLTPM